MEDKKGKQTKRRKGLAGERKYGNEGENEENTWRRIR
jgi:hypothetical protein